MALCLPRVLGRLPYGKDTKPIEDFNYEEHVDGSDHGKYLWMNAAYTLAARMTNSFSSFGMCVCDAWCGRRGPVKDFRCITITLTRATSP